MNAENAMVLADGRQFTDAGRQLRGQVRKLRRALGLVSAPRAPARPQVLHPIESLTFHNGAICHLSNDQVAGEYMGLSGIEVIRKLSLKELADERCEYRFELTVPTDPIWRFYVKKLLPDVCLQFESRTLVLTCPPANLEWSYLRTKEAIEQANLWYAEERECLISVVMGRDEERRTAREMEENRKFGLRRQFEHLEL
jgi:hypothetical protein